MMNYSSSGSIRNAAVVNAVDRGAVAVILVRAESNSAPPGPFSLSTPQPDVPVVGGGSAHRVWINDLLAAGPLTLTIATNRYVGLEGANVIGVRHAVNDPEGKTAPIVMIGAHIDSVLGGPGAHDNATGPAASLEVARVLSQYALDKEIRFGGYGNEEGGLRGSRAYVAS
jgi:Iap family predicted aminopeptidase